MSDEAIELAIAYHKLTRVRLVEVKSEVSIAPTMHYFAIGYNEQGHIVCALGSTYGHQFGFLVLQNMTIMALTRRGLL